MKSSIYKFRKIWCTLMNTEMELNAVNKTVVMWNIRAKFDCVWMFMVHLDMYLLCFRHKWVCEGANEYVKWDWTNTEAIVWKLQEVKGVFWSISIIAFQFYCGLSSSSAAARAMFAAPRLPTACMWKHDARLQEFCGSFPAAALTLDMVAHSLAAAAEPSRKTDEA